MESQDAAYLSAAMAVDDEAVQQHLIGGYHAVRACCRLADGDVTGPGDLERLAPAAGPRLVPPGDASIAEAVLALDMELATSRGNVSVPLVRAVGRLGEALFGAGLLAVALPVVELAQRLGARCNAHDEALPSAFRHYLLLVRGVRTGIPTRHLAFTLALQARRAGNREYVGAARYVEAERLMLAGNLPAALRRAERLLPWAMKHGSLIVEGAAYNVLAAIHGRAGRFTEAAHFAARAVAPHFPSTYQFSALVLLGRAFSDLGMPREARAAFELAAAGPLGVSRRMALAGLIEILANADDRAGFERLYRHLQMDRLLLPGARVAFFRDAGRAWARFGEPDRARADLERAYQLAREIGMGLEIMRTEDDLERLARAPRPSSPPAAVRRLEVAVNHVMSLRTERHAHVAACLP